MNEEKTNENEVAEESEQEVEATDGTSEEEVKTDEANDDEEVAKDDE